jgi:predicted nucleic acid-binding protein
LRIFVDSCVALAACLSKTGASRLIFEIAATQGWELVVSRWVLREMRENLADWPLLFHVTKDKPVLCTALACADVLLTLDRRDFGSLLGQSVYDLRVLTPGAFLEQEGQSGRLKG